DYTFDAKKEVIDDMLKTWPRLKTIKKGDGVDQGLKEAAADFRKTIKGKIEKLQSAFFYDDCETLMTDIYKCAPVAEMISKLASELDYYFKADGEMAVNCWVESKWVGPDGKFTGQTRQVGWITNNGIRCYYDQNSRLVTGWLTLSGKKYYLNTSTGALQYGWFTVGGSQYYANAEGVVQCNAWVGKKFTGDSGAVIKGWKTISGKRYYFDPATGDYSVGWKKIKDKYFYFNTSGVKQVSKWIDGAYYVTKTGQRAIGVKKIDSNYYYFSYSMEGKLLKGWVRYSGSLYYAHPEKGYLLRNKWFKMNGKQYYAGSDCKLAQGLVTIGGKKYYFNAETGYMYKKTRIRIKNNIYYFGSDGSQVKSKWVKIQDKYYYFE
ncbi:MAG: hypothetical protein HUJ75_02060, partial [Parasporobacterium sp.]|nr:hypothetical protein [Parasporobacterium sp.]